MSSKRKLLELENEQKIMKEKNKNGSGVVVSSVKTKKLLNNSSSSSSTQSQAPTAYEIDNSDCEDGRDNEENQVTSDDYYDVSKVNIEEIMTTEEVAQNLKSFLAKERIKHEIFSKSILGCSKSTLARLLYEPKTWETVNDMWKLYFKIIHLWLNDKKRLDKLKYNKKVPLTVKVEATSASDKSPNGTTTATMAQTTATAAATNDTENDIIETFRSNNKKS